MDIRLSAKRWKRNKNSKRTKGWFRTCPIAIRTFLLPYHTLLTFALVRCWWRSSKPSPESFELSQLSCAELALAPCSSEFRKDPRGILGCGCNWVCCCCWRCWWLILLEAECARLLDVTVLLWTDPVTADNLSPAL